MSMQLVNIFSLGKLLWAKSSGWHQCLLSICLKINLLYKQLIKCNSNEFVNAISLATFLIVNWFVKL